MICTHDVRGSCVSPGGVGGLESPLTVIVSGGFADGAGRFPLAENIPYTKEWPGA